MMKMRLFAFDLVTRHPFGISRGTTSSKPTLIVELEQDGVRGYGEATEYAYYGVLRPETMSMLASVRSTVESHVLQEPAEFWQIMHESLSAQASARSVSPGQITFPLSALDTAAHDLWGKLQGRAVWDLWGLDIGDIPCSNYTIGIDSVEVMQAKLAEYPDFPVYKIKLGTDDDLAIVRALRACTTSVFRIDANAGWTMAETRRNADIMRELNVEFIEQPLLPDEWNAMRALYPSAALPFVADESCMIESDVGRCAGHFHGINIKLEKCGGLTPARRMIAKARSEGLRVMLGCFTESTVGISALAQLLPLADYADLDGAMLLANDIAEGVRIDSGRVHFPDESGCGVRML
jgi:L-alanine-DL-glutamate epimerase-like enolase superfamily enzyme